MGRLRIDPARRGASRSTILRWGDERLRLGPWRGDRHRAVIAPLVSGRVLSRAAVGHALEMAERAGYDEVLTSALTPREAAPFLADGFAERERLHLLRHDLFDLPDPGPTRLRRARARDRADVLEVDGAAFPPFWRLDDEGLTEALTATPAVRFRVVVEPPAAGYAVSGRAGTTGYLQRLAVRPDAQGRGLGRDLVVDALHWFVRRGAKDALVNTQEINEGALALYEALGFRRMDHGLAVFSRSVGDPAA